MVDAKRNADKMDVSIKDDALDDLPAVERKHAKPAQVTANGRAAIKSHVRKAQKGAAIKPHPYLRRNEYYRRSQSKRR